MSTHQGTFPLQEILLRLGVLPHFSAQQLVALLAELASMSRTEALQLPQLEQAVCAAQVQRPWQEICLHALLKASKTAPTLLLWYNLKDAGI